MIKYVGTQCSGQIRVIQIKKETDKFVVFNDGTRQAKTSDYQSIFDTFDQCKEWLLKCCDRKIMSLQSELDRLKSKKQKINNTNHAHHS